MLVILTPGPDTALTIRNTVLGGRRGGVFTALGVSVGQIIWAVATSLGLVALLLAAEPLFRAVKLAGAGYLVYLGGVSVLAAFHPAPSPAPVVDGTRRPSRAAPRCDRGSSTISGTPRWPCFFASVCRVRPRRAVMLSAVCCSV